MTDDLFAYVIVIGIGSFALGIQLGCIWAARILRAEYERNPLPSNRCYDEGYTDGSTGKARRWYL